MFNFEQVEKRASTNPLPPKAIRVTKYSFAVTYQSIEKFLIDGTRASVVLNVDKKNMAIKLTKGEGYLLTNADDKGNAKGNVFYCALPAYLRRINIAKGDYLPVDGHADVYQHTDFIAEPLGDKAPEVAYKPGDKVTWQARLHNKRTFVEGTVVEMYGTTFGSKVKRPAARIKVESEEYKKIYPSRGLTTVSVDKLIKVTQE